MVSIVLLCLFCLLRRLIPPRFVAFYASGRKIKNSFGCNLQVDDEWKVHLGQDLFLGIDVLNLLQSHHFRLLQHLHGIE